MTFQPTTQKAGDFICAEVIQGVVSSLSTTRKLRWGDQSFEFKEERRTLEERNSGSGKEIMCALGNAL